MKNTNITILKKVYLICLFLILVLSSSILSQTKEFSEYVIKAAFLERFTRFIKWQGNNVESNTTKPFIIAVIGKNPFDDALDQIAAIQKIKKRKVEIQYIKNINQGFECNILFICKSEKSRLTQIIDYTYNKPILTVSETKGFSEKGVIINFYMEKNKLKFEINETAARNSKLYISHLILRTARVVHPWRKDL